ncbi:ABC transporter ATP-binding protein [Neisseria dentiae]|uniref:ABC transporter ATP-binding protein n=1 Tax=Neisseria dentiae TaxID=194197 RepID=UPI0035A167A2
MLQLKHINKRYGGKTVADDISLEVNDGMLLAVLGRSGCGKSTLLKIAAGLVEPDSGEVWINGENRTRVPPERRHISLVFQDYALLPHLNVLQNVAFGLKMRGVGTTEAQRRAEAMLAEVGLADEAERRPESLSGGEQQRVALARALVTEPQLMLLDEPFSSLDTGLRSQLRQLTAENIRRRNIPAVMVTHDPEEAFALAGRIALMHNGRIIQLAEPDMLIAAPADARAARLIGAENVSNERYIPQQALCFNHPHGAASKIVSHTRLPDRSLITLRHPQHGDIRLYLDPAQSGNLNLQPGSEWPLGVDESQVVRFG